MEALKFNTKILENGIIQIPEFDLYKDQEIKIIVLFKNKPETISQNKKPIEDFFEKWSGHFNVIESDDIRYNALKEKHL